MRLTASRRVAKVITGCKPKSAAVLPAITDIPYSAPPGRTQSPCEPGQPSTAAELASERGPGRTAVASANNCSCARDRKSVVKGTRVLVRVGLGGRRRIKKHNNKK